MHTPKFPQIVVHVIIIDQWNQTARLYEIRETVIDSRAILVTVTSERSVKRVVYKISTRALEDSADPDQMPQNAASDQDMHCSYKL